MGAGVLQGLGDGGSSGGAAEGVLFLVPELLFLAFMAAVALGSGLRVVASLRRSTKGWPGGSRAPPGRSGVGGRLGRRFPAALVGAARTAVAAAVAVPVLLRSVRAVGEATVTDLAMAATLAAAAAGLAVAGVVVVAAAVEASAVVLARRGK